MNNKFTIKDIYVGKPDAKDEINFDGIDNFVNSYVIPESFDLNALLKGQSCYITGYKGTGKTALLFYLDYLLKSETPYACSSFIFFKQEYTETKKQEMEGFSKRISSCISLQNNELIENTDFTYIWRWMFFKRIVSDNEEFSNKLFEDNKNWKNFRKIIDSIKAPADNKKSIIPPKIKISADMLGQQGGTECSPGLEVDFSKSGREYNYIKFIELLDQAEKLFINLNRTNIPYYIFVDELEAYYGEVRIFKRDLRFIRDLIFTVKKFNEIFNSFGKNTKVLCSVRTEIINAISRFIVSKEMNKVINGFEIPIIWNYSNTSSYHHPIIQVLLKRIQSSQSENKMDDKEIYQKWFPEKIHDIEPIGYILNNGWNKPRDIVRLLSSAQASIKSNESSFNQSVFDAIKKKYSDDSLIEITEELRALYSVDDTEMIISCFTGFKTIFSINQLKQRVSAQFPNTYLDTKLTSILHDLYRLGFLGNYLPYAGTYRWQHKGDNRLIISEEYRLMIHYALHSALSLGGRQDYGLSKYDVPEIGDVVTAKVIKIIPSFVLVEFTKKMQKYEGCIHISKLGFSNYIKDIHNAIQLNTEHRAVIIDYNSKHENWLLRIESNDNKLKE